MLNAYTLITELLSAEQIKIERIMVKYAVSADFVRSLVEELESKGYSIEICREFLRLRDIPDILYPELITHTLDCNLIGSNIIHYIQACSTNSEAIEMCRSGRLEEGTVLIAEHQTAGRGRYNRTWRDAAGMSLLYSVILQPSFLELNNVFSLTVITSLSIIDAVRDVTGAELSIKWPNDIYYHDKKIAGILIETQSKRDRLSWAVIGIGLNINQPENLFSNASYNATSLRVVTGEQVNRHETCRKLLRYLDTYYDILRNDGYEQLFNRWQKYCSSIGRSIVFGEMNKSTGIVKSVLPDGRLSVITSSGEEVKVVSGDLE